METRFIVPGGTVANLDFVEGIFGNGGDPYLPENDASLAPETWTGHTGCVILAPHLTRVTKKELGLPHVSEATERQQRDGMCWESEDELYNGGRAFKICARDARGVIVTVIADTYFGYCKKEVKTQISYSANLFGNAEEEHSGGALVFASYNLGQEYDDRFSGDDYRSTRCSRATPTASRPSPRATPTTASSRTSCSCPGGAHYSMHDMTVSWTRPDGGTGSVPLRADKAYLSPNGYRVTVAQQPHDPTHLDPGRHRPQRHVVPQARTVSGGGKSEISKAITDAFIVGSAFVADFETDMDAVDRDPRPRLLPALPRPRAPRHRPAPDPVAATARSARSSSCSPRRARTSTPTTTRGCRASRPTSRSSSTSSSAPTARNGARTGAATSASPMIDGRQGNSLHLDGTKITLNMLRVGYDPDGSWRLFSLRHDFSPAVKVQTQDDITASTVVPGALLGLDPARSYKFVENCENLLFQRPDDAIHRGYDTRGRARHRDPRHLPVQLRAADPRGCRRRCVTRPCPSRRFSPPMAALISGFADTAEGDGPAYVVSSANPRLVDGAPVEEPALPPAASRPHRREGHRRRRALRAPRPPDAGRRATPPARSTSSPPGGATTRRTGRCRRCAPTARCTTWRSPSSSWSSSPR